MTTSKQVAGGSAAGDRHSSTPCGWRRPAVEEKAQCAVRSKYCWGKRGGGTKEDTGGSAVGIAPQEGTHEIV